MENNSAKYQMTGQSNQLTKQDVFDFLLNAYFGNVDDPFFVAIDSAYLDVNRTVEFKKSEMIITEENKNELRKQAVALIKTEIQSVQRKTDVNQESFDMWHKNLCRARF